MISSLKEVHPVVVLPQKDGGRVEISIVDDMIWISDYAKNDKGKEVSNFTLCVPRGPLDGAPDAAAGVHDLYKRRAFKPAATRSGGTEKRSEPQSAALARIAAAMAGGPPSKAGYWFVDSTITPHGGPVVVLDP